jgi:hypothetical protein
MPGFRKTVKKAGRNFRKNIKKRYFKGKGYKNPKLIQMARDVNMIKGMLNTEKKKIVVSQKDGAHFGQTVDSSKTTTTTGEALYSQRDNVLYSGAYVKNNLLPITRGSGQGEVSGDKMKLVSYHLDARVSFFKGNGAFIRGPAKATIYLVAIKRGIFPLISNSNGATSGILYDEALLDKFLIPSPFDNTYDANSKRNFEFMKEFTVVAQKDIYMTLNEDNDSLGNPQKDRSMGGKLNHHVRLDAGGTDIHTNQLALIVVANQGKVTGTGSDPFFLLEYEMTSYFVDN